MRGISYLSPRRKQFLDRSAARAFSSLANLSVKHIAKAHAFHPFRTMAAVTDGGIIASKRRDLYPPIEPYTTGTFEAGDGYHTIYYEESGNQAGIPVVFVHGGPGGGTQPINRQFFDPAAYRIILFDQRGCGKSTPHADLKDNTTWHLVADMEQLRELLQIEKWVVFGGSWGSTLSLTYGIKHTDRCLALILRGIFMLRRSELEWFYEQKGGALNAYPDAWEEYLKPIPEEERGELIKAYYKRLTSDDQAVRSEAAKAWSIWEGTTSKLVVDADAVKKYGGDEFADAFARVECHYFLNGGFFETDAWILENAHKLKEVPGVIVQGRYDIVCPARSAWDLHRVWPEAEFHMVQDAGHNAYEPGIKAELLDACDLFAQKLAK